VMDIEEKYSKMILSSPNCENDSIEINL
jgi:hypothetical protein